MGCCSRLFPSAFILLVPLICFQLTGGLLFRSHAGTGLASTTQASQNHQQKTTAQFCDLLHIRQFASRRTGSACAPWPPLKEYAGINCYETTCRVAQLGYSCAISQDVVQSLQAVAGQDGSVLPAMQTAAHVLYGVDVQVKGGGGSILADYARTASRWVAWQGDDEAQRPWSPKTRRRKSRQREPSDRRKGGGKGSGKPSAKGPPKGSPPPQFAAPAACFQSHCASQDGGGRQWRPRGVGTGHGPS